MGMEATDTYSGDGRETQRGRGSTKSLPCEPCEDAAVASQQGKKKESIRPKHLPPIWSCCTNQSAGSSSRHLCCFYESEFAQALKWPFPGCSCPSGPPAGRPFQRWLLIFELSLLKHVKVRPSFISFRLQVKTIGDTLVLSWELS